MGWVWENVGRGEGTERADFKGQTYEGQLHGAAEA